MPGLLRCTCGDYARVLISFRTRGCGCSWHPAFPAPLFCEAKDLVQLGLIAPRDRRRVCPTSLQGAKRTKQSILLCAARCFAEPVIGRAFRATRWLAMTSHPPAMDDDPG